MELKRSRCRMLPQLLAHALTSRHQRLFKALLCAFVALLLGNNIPVQAYSYTYTTDDGHTIRIRYDINTGTDGKKYAVITGIGARYSGTEAEVSIPSTFTYNSEEIPVTTIKTCAVASSSYYYSANIASIIIPTSVTSINDGAFYSSSKYWCNLKSVTFEGAVTSIGNNAFKNCSALADINLPSGLESIGDYAFQGCTALTSMPIPASVTSLGEGVFYGCI